MYRNMNSEEFIKEANQPLKQSDPQVVNRSTLFAKAAAEKNILFKRDMDQFYDAQDEKDTPENFVRNYHNFYNE